MRFIGDIGASVALTAMLLLWCEPACAEEAGDVARAAELMEMAEFDGALEALTAAERAGGLSRDDVLRVETLRALIHHALGDERAIERALHRLASLEPALRFDETVPPALQERFDRIAASREGPLELVAEATEIRGGYRIEVSVRNDDGRLVEETQIFARVPGGEWVRTEGPRASIPASGGTVVEYYVRALGPGGAVLFEGGSEEAPRTIGTSGPDAGDERIEAAIRDAAGEGERRRPSPWVWVGVGVGVAAVAAGVVVAVLLAGAGQVTTMDAPPEVSWP